MKGISNAVKYMKSRRAFTVIFLLTLISFVVFISWAFLLGQSLRLDEAQSLWQSAHSPLQILNIISHDVHVPLYHFIIHFWQVFLGDDVAVQRVFSLILLIIAIPIVYILGKTAFNKQIGLMSALFISISPFMNWYGNEIRMYTLLVLFTVINQLFFVRIIKFNKETDWYGYAISALFGVYSHYFFIFNLVTAGIYYLINRKVFQKGTFKKFIITAIILAIAFIPWLVYVYLSGSSSNTQPLLIKPSSIDFFNTYSRFIFGFQEDSANTIILAIWPISILLGFLALGKNKRLNTMSGYFLFAALFPIALAFIVSLFVRPLFVTRYLIVSLPALYIFISWILSLYKGKVSVFLHIALVIAMLGTLFVQIFNINTPVKENYAQVGSYLNANASAHDVVVISAPFTIYPIEYYYNGKAFLYTLPLWNREVQGAVPAFSESTLPDEVKSIKGSHEIAWVVLSYDQGYEKIIKNYYDNHFERLSEQTFSPGLHLYAYKLRYDIKSN